MQDYKILFINADLDNAQEVVNAINLPKNITFTLVQAGLEALSDLGDEIINLLIVHEKLSHKMSGMEVCELLMKNKGTSCIPIIFLKETQTEILECSNIKRYINLPYLPLDLEKEILIQYNLFNNIAIDQPEKKLISSILNKIHAPIFIISKDEITFANKFFLDFFKIDRLEDLTKKYPNIQDLFFLENEEEEFSLLTWLKEILQAEDEQDIIMKNHDEERIYLKLRGELLEHSDEYLIITQDISSEIRHAKEVEGLYNTDPLTKLPNRLKLLSDLESYDELSLAILDIDDFKLINDFYGHIIGDYVINEVSQRISHYISHESLVLYRLPSDSFAILNNAHIEKEYFEIIIISLIQIVSKSAFVYEYNNEKIEIQVNLSSGIVFEKDNALAHADIALREAKKTHKDYVVYNEGMRQEITNKNNLIWIQKVKTALANDKIVPYFQPIVDNKTKKTIKYECLVRLIDEENEVISPYFFLEVAKQAKLYEPITKIMIKKSFQTFTNKDFEFSINLSIEDITDYNLFGYIKNMLSIFPLASKVCFEILETEKIEDYQVISDFVTEVRKLGCKVSIDDFGSGYSNFSHLLNLNFDYLKIDASLIKDIHKDKHKQIIVKTIVTFAKELGIKTIGEFVESKEIYDYITEMGIDYSQGYYFSPPVESIE